MRSYTLDWIRVIAMIGVVLDHYLQSTGVTILVQLGLQLGGACVAIFFAISAYLFGRKWIKDDCRNFQPIEFFKKRCLRIYLPMWIVILFVISIEYYSTGRFEAQIIFFNSIGLGWAKPFGISGHLWYITMLMILYICFVAFSYCRLDKIKWHVWFIAFIVLIANYFVFEDHITTFSKAEPPIIILSSALIFAKGNEILDVAKRYKMSFVLVTIVMVTCSFYVYIAGWHYSHKALATLSSALSGLLVFFFLYACLNVTKGNNVIKWLSGISYEVYLVHLPLMPVCDWLVGNELLKVILWLSLTIILAVLLNKCVAGN